MDDEHEFDDYDDFLDEDEDAWLDECGAHGGDSDIDAWQNCTMAGTEHCDFECPLAREVRAKLRRIEQEGESA